MIQLPNNHVASAEVNLIDRGGLISGVLGGDDQRVDRIGAKFAVNFTLRPLTAEQARIFIPRLLRAGREMGYIKFPQAGMRNEVLSQLTLAATAPANQEAVTFTPVDSDRSKTAYEGQALQINAGSFFFIHMLTADVFIPATGNVTFPIFPPLRRTFDAGSAATLNSPQMQGYPKTEDQKWSIDLAKTRGIAFTMVEAH